MFNYGLGCRPTRTRIYRALQAVPRCDNHHINTNDTQIDDPLVNHCVHLAASAAPKTPASVPAAATLTLTM